VKQHRLASIALALWMVAQSVSGAVYYVDYDAGSDSNAGTSTGTAFKRCPGDTEATGTAASTVLTGGDLVKFKGGTIYRGSVKFNRSGGIGSPITYDGNSAGDWGTGKAVMNATNHPTIVSAFEATAAVSNLVIKNFEITEYGGYHVLPAANGCSAPVSTEKPGVGIKLYDYRTQDILIQDCYMYELGEWHPIDPFEDGAISGGGVSLQDAHRVTISGCEFTKMFNAIGIKTDTTTGIGTSDITVTNCNIHNYVAWGIDIAARAAGCTLSNIVIIASDFHDYQEYDLGQWAGCGSRPHSDGVFIRNVYSSNTWAGWNRIEGCRFYNTNNVGGGSACISITEGPSFDIINNLFMNTVHPRTIYLHNGAHAGDAAQTNNIWNNTFWNDHTAINLTRGGYDLGWVSVKNNIFYDTRTGSSSTFVIYSEENYTSMRPDELDYNVYVTFNTLGSIWLASGLGELDFSEVQGLGYEANGVEVDPLFVDTSHGIETTILDNDLRLQSGSPAIDIGATITAIGWDSYRTTRPQGAAFDVGFFEFQSGPQGVSVDALITPGGPRKR
jgi:hypothetical protein